MEHQAHDEQSFGGTTTAPTGISFPPAADDAIAEEAGELARADYDWFSDGADLMRATRCWIQYGLVGFTILCILVGAVEALFGR